MLYLLNIIILSACNETNSVSDIPPERPIKVTSIFPQDLGSINKCQEGTLVKNKGLN